MNEQATRAGRFVRQLSGYVSFVPHPLPPEPPLQVEGEMWMLLSNADRGLGRLDGITRTLPNPDLFVDMYVKKESLLSSQIEGTQASFADILVSEKRSPTAEQREVSNYVAALRYGLKRLQDLPLSLRLIREIHAVLLSTGRGSERSPGQFRESQNWIGAPGSTLTTATFVPPSVPDMMDALANLETFFHTGDDLPPLVKIALIHAQFESIHPFLDGNGRVGRLLITFWLVYQNILEKPLLYLSIYFKQHRAEYYDRLMDVRKTGAWEAWVKFFLRGVTAVSEDATKAAQRILQLRNSISETLKGTPHWHHGSKLLDYLFAHPILARQEAASCLGVSAPTAISLLRAFERLGILKQANPNAKRNIRFVFTHYLEILEEGTH